MDEHQIHIVSEQARFGGSVERGEEECEDGTLFAVCKTHDRKRAVEYMKDNGDGTYECEPGQECKIPTAHLREPAAVFWYFCECCQIVLNSERQYSLHTRGNKHQHKVKELGALFLKRGLNFEEHQPRIIPEGTSRAEVLSKNDPIEEALSKPLIGKHAAKQAKASKKKKVKQQKEKEREEREMVAAIVDDDEVGNELVMMDLGDGFGGIAVVDEEVDVIMSPEDLKCKTAPPAIYGTGGGSPKSFGLDFGRAVWSGGVGSNGDLDAGSRPLSSASAQTLPPADSHTGSLGSSAGLRDDPLLTGRPIGTAPANQMAAFAKAIAGSPAPGNAPATLAGFNSAPTLTAMCGGLDSERAWQEAELASGGSVVSQPEGAAVGVLDSRLTSENLASGSQLNSWVLGAWS